jgi:hypothetical protein
MLSQGTTKRTFIVFGSEMRELVALLGTVPGGNYTP